MSAQPAQIIHPGFRFVPMIGHPIGQVITPEPMNRHFTSRGIEAAIVGKALYERRFTLAEAIEATEGE